MRRLYITSCIVVSLLTGSCKEVQETEISWFSSGNGGIVAAGPKASVAAGLEMLIKGGNAVDAAVAAIFNLAVSDVLKDGKPVIVMSVAGGNMQDQTSIQLILANIEFGMKPREALLSPRFYTYHTENSFRPSPEPNIRLNRIGALNINKPKK